MRTLILLTTTALLLVSPGCQTTTVGPGGMVAMPLQPMSPQPVPVAGTIHEGRPADPRSAAKLKESDPDPCANRLDDLITPLYEYYARFHRLPDKLEDLGTVADYSVLRFTCPVSGKLYIYNPVGLQSQAGDVVHLILYDAAPVHNGRRFGVLAGPAPNRFGQVFYQMNVVQLTEAVFKSFVQAPASIDRLRAAPASQPATELPAELPPVSDQGVGTPFGQP